MPQRPRQHELDTMAERLFENQLPAAWTCEKVVHDYGKDLNVEIFENQEATGYEFIVQSKGHERFTIVHSDQIAQPIRISTLKYLESKLNPAMIVAFSAETQKAHYLWVGPYVHEVLDKKQPEWRGTAGDSEITLHVPLENSFTTSAHPEIRNYVASEHAELSRRRLNSTPSNTRVSTLKSNLLIRSHRLDRPQIKSFLPRSRLTNKIIGNQTGSIFIHADAGYGKTWLVHDFIATNKQEHLLWYTFDENFVDARQFIRELASDLYKQTNSLGAITLSYLSERMQEDQSIEGINILLSEVEAFDAPILFVIEDLHFAPDLVANKVIKQILLSKPPNLQVIITSRHPLPVRQTRLKAERVLTVIDREELAFQLDETKQYLENELETNLSLEQVQKLHDRANGWIAALSLAANALTKRAPNQATRLLEQLNGFDGDIYEFFAEEVYSNQNESTRKLLRRMGTVEVVQSDIVNLFTLRPNGGQVLRELHQHGAFLTKTQQDSYRIHSLFAEFLQAKLLEEEGQEALYETHRHLAYHYREKQEWYSMVQHAIKCNEYPLALEGLNKIASVSINLGYGYFFIQLIHRVPSEFLDKSASLQEMIGRAALQISDLSTALEAFFKAHQLYQDKKDIKATYRIEYFIAEIHLDTTKISTADFVQIANKVAIISYEQGDFFFGSQAELRAIETEQTLIVLSENKSAEVTRLINRCDNLIVRLEQAGTEYDLIRAKVLVSKAHLSVQTISIKLQQDSMPIRLKMELGFEIPTSTKLELLQTFDSDLKSFLYHYEEAESLLENKNEIQQAFTRLRRLEDMVYLNGIILLTSLANEKEADFVFPKLKTFINGQMIKSFLPMLDECGRVFAKYHLFEGIANVYYLAADIYDILGEDKRRDNAAKEALNIAEEKGLVNLAERIQRLLEGKRTYSSALVDVQTPRSDKAIASWGVKEKKHYVETFLMIFEGDVDEERRIAVEQAVEDMYAAAIQRIEWCRHIEIMENTKHQESMDTLLRTTPQKFLICKELGHRSINKGYSFEELWPFFKGVFCLGCTSRNPNK